jgi:hypothetical protein
MNECMWNDSIQDTVISTHHHCALHATRMFAGLQGLTSVAFETTLASADDGGADIQEGRSDTCVKEPVTK